LLNLAEILNVKKMKKQGSRTARFPPTKNLEKNIKNREKNISEKNRKKNWKKNCLTIWRENCAKCFSFNFLTLAGFVSPAWYGMSSCDL
jgi:hypothetical protein